MKKISDFDFEYKNGLNIKNILLTNVKSNKLSKGTKIMMENEKIHALEAIDSGIYITWNSINKSECFRIGSQSMCVCNHSFNNHQKILNRNKFSSKCMNCKCTAFIYIPIFPEEIGEYWIPYQKEFDYSTWKAKCKCKHSWKDHTNEKFLMCRLCSCSKFNSAFCCVVCDQFWNDHEMNYELEHDRYMNNKAIGEAFLPLREFDELSKELYASKNKKNN